MCNHLHKDEIAQLICDIEDALKAAIDGADVEVTDPMGNGHHFNVTVTALQFADKPRLAQHRMVIDALSGLLKENLHAVVVKTKTK